MNMIKVFVTGDVHIGKKYDRFADIKEDLIQSRFDCLDKAIKEAEKKNCDYFVVTGDLFDSVSNIKQTHVQKVVDILSGFGGRVLVLPGNHDYYTGEEKVWKDFVNSLDKTDHNIILITKMEPLVFDDGDEPVTFYPAYCQKKHSEENNLGWIKKSKIDRSVFNIGIAHGSISGLSPDLKNEYFLMTEQELNSIPVDAWLIGHTHIPYPTDLQEDQDMSGYTIFNAGTPEQTDLSNNTEGICFILTMDKKQRKTVVNARKFVSGSIRYFDLRLEVGKAGLDAAIEEIVKGLPDRSVVRLTVSGSVPEEEFSERGRIYERHLDRFLTYEIEDSELSERITVEKIRSEFAEIGFAANLLENLMDPKEVQMAYELIKKYQA